MQKEQQHFSNTLENTTKVLVPLQHQAAFTQSLSFFIFTGNKFHATHSEVQRPPGLLGLYYSYSWVWREGAGCKKIQIISSAFVTWPLPIQNHGVLLFQLLRSWSGQLQLEAFSLLRATPDKICWGQLLCVSLTCLLPFPACWLAWCFLSSQVTSFKEVARGQTDHFFCFCSYYKGSQHGFYCLVTVFIINNNNNEL